MQFTALLPVRGCEFACHRGFRSTKDSPSDLKRANTIADNY